MSATDNSTNELTFAMEVFQVAIFLTTFRIEFFKNTDLKEISADFIAKHLKSILPIDEPRWHIDFSALYQGLKYFKSYIEKTWLLKYDDKQSETYGIPAFHSFPALPTSGFFLDFSSAYSIGDASHFTGSSLSQLPPLNTVMKSRDFLLKKKSLTKSVFKLINFFTCSNPLTI